ncbi:preprotein translocase subunit YajC [Qipengyuania sp. JC766]|uniref:preprotein translocase subunit YajC n=1 Tax=Qipengyuania sp. JC766 TaxID=3232139 RepID=UPI00345B34E4
MKLALIPAISAIALAAAPQPAAAQDADEQRERRVEVEPYIEASQILTAELSPGDEVVTYTQLAAGVDASVTGRNNGGSVSLRVEQNIGYDDDSLDSTSLSGVARGYATLVPNTLTVEAGGLAATTRIDGNGGTSLNPIAGDDGESTIYSGYVGPNLTTRAGPAEITANYRFGYTRVESPDVLVIDPAAGPIDVFDESTTHSANARIATGPRDPLPVGVGVGGGFFQEDVDNLDQRVRDAYVRADVTVPLSPTFAVVGGVGYEDVEVSSRDALLGDDGLPVIDSNGRFVTDTSEPRRIAFETDGLIWDVGVVWRPSTRTALEAHVGRRYDSTTYYGSFAWAPNRRSSVNVSVYDAVTGFGGTLNTALANLPTDFTAARNALTGDLTGCTVGEQGANCLGGVLASVRSSIFRSRGVSASYSRSIGRMDAGVGIGYDQREFIAAEGTILAIANGVTDESYYATAFLSGDVGNAGSFNTSIYANRLESGFLNAGDLTTYGASAGYGHQLGSNLSARAAIALDHLDSDIDDEDLTAASALLGVSLGF